MNDVGNVGERWRLHLIGGGTAEYIVEHAPPDDQPKAVWLKLRNVATDGVAVITRHWLRTSPYTPGGPRWERLEAVAA